MRTKADPGSRGVRHDVLCRELGLYDHDVVVKALHSVGQGRLTDDGFAEARILIKINHPAIIGVLDCGYAYRRHRPYIAMEHFDGISLEQFVHENGPISPDQLLAVARQIAEGVREAHSRNVCHRDLKPGNVLVRVDEGKWQVKIIDFGLAIRRQAMSKTLLRATEDKTILGRSFVVIMLYAPPEQMGRTGGEIGPHSDVYSFGKLCCHALFGTTDLKLRHWASLPETLATLLEKCTEEDPAARHPDFSHVLGSIAEGWKGESVDSQFVKLKEYSDWQKEKLNELRAEFDMYLRNDPCFQDINHQFEVTYPWCWSDWARAYKGNTSYPCNNCGGEICMYDNGETYRGDDYGPPMVEVECPNCEAALTVHQIDEYECDCGAVFVAIAHLTDPGEDVCGGEIDKSTYVPPDPVEIACAVCARIQQAFPFRQQQCACGADFKVDKNGELIDTDDEDDAEAPAESE